MNRTSDPNFSFECRRKSFHLLGLILPLFYLTTSRLNMSVLLLFLTTITLYFDISRHYNLRIKGLIQKIFGNIIRPQEDNGQFVLSGASFMAAGLLVSCLFCSQSLAITSWLILIISDCFAALVGIKIGTPLSNGKSIAGSATFIISSLIISLCCKIFLALETTLLVMIFSCLLTGVVEFYSKTIRINDNLSIPLTYALSTYLGNLVF